VDLKPVHLAMLEGVGLNTGIRDRIAALGLEFITEEWVAGFGLVDGKIAEMVRIFRFCVPGEVEGLLCLC